MNLTPIDRTHLREQARLFIGSPAFDRHYERVHVDAWIWYVANLFCCCTIVGLPSAFRRLLNSRKQVFTSDALKANYRTLVEKGRIVEGHLLLNNSTLSENPTACAPALIAACLDGTDEGDAAAGLVTEDIMDRIFLMEEDSPATKTVQALIEDEEYVAFRKRPLPPAFTEGRHVHLLDVKIDNTLIKDGSLFSSKRLYFLVDPAPKGLVLLLPNVQVTPPPFPAASSHLQTPPTSPAIGTPPPLPTR